MLNKQFLIHLSLIEGIGPTAVQKIMKNRRSDSNISDLYLFSVADWMHYYGFTPGSAQKLVAGLSDKKILETELYLVEKNNIQLTTILDDHYPALLREIYMPPTVLYYQGGNFDDSKKHIAIVGARASTTYGHHAVKMLVPELVRVGVVIVSGGARGIDTTAHEQTVQSGGTTIVVLGSGLLKPYPASNKKLFDNIVEKGGIILSAFPLLVEPLPGNFPARNRIISGLSHGCVVVQAAQKSGALITAYYALEQGREVFAVPGSFDDPLSVGCHELIQRGAKLIMSSADIVEECALVRSVVRDVQTTLFNAQQLLQQEREQLSVINEASYSENQKKIIAACRQSASLDDIMLATHFDIATVQMELFTLQLDGKVEQDFIGRWMTTR